MMNAVQQNTDIGNIRRRLDFSNEENKPKRQTTNVHMFLNLHQSKPKSMHSDSSLLNKSSSSSIQTQTQQTSQESLSPKKETVIPSNSNTINQNNVNNLSNVNNLNKNVSNVNNNVSNINIVNNNVSNINPVSNISTSSISDNNSSVPEQKYAGGGYSKSPNPKSFSKPSLSSPLKSSPKKISSLEDSPSSSSEQPKSNTLHHSVSVPLLGLSPHGSTTQGNVVRFDSESFFKIVNSQQQRNPYFTQSNVK